MGITHFSLFSGIGGLDLAAEWAGFQSVAQCEIADYPTWVLQNHWPDVPRWRDIRDVTAKSFRERTGITSPTILSGGFPCQPHSTAGKRLGSRDERDLWDEFARVICELRPRWVVGENVEGLLSSETGRYFGRVLRNLAGLGYRVGWCCYPAAWVGAAHRRNRVFIIAYAGSQFGQGILNQDSRRFETGNQASKERGEDWPKFKLAPGVIKILYAGYTERIKPLLTRADDGFPAAVDRIKGLGNAVVPQQAYPIFQVIAAHEKVREGGTKIAKNK